MSNPPKVATWQAFKKAASSFASLSARSSISNLTLMAFDGSWHKWAVKPWHPFFSDYKRFKQGLEALIDQSESMDDWMEQFSTEFSWADVDVLCAMSKNIGFKEAHRKALLMGVCAFLIKHQPHLEESDEEADRRSILSSWVLNQSNAQEKLETFEKVSRWIIKNKIECQTLMEYQTKIVRLVMNKSNKLTATEEKTAPKSPEKELSLGWHNLLKVMEVFNVHFFNRGMFSAAHLLRSTMLNIMDANQMSTKVSNKCLDLFLDVSCLDFLNSIVMNDADLWQQRWAIEGNPTIDSYLMELKKKNIDVIASIDKWAEESQAITPLELLMKQVSFWNEAIDLWSRNLDHEDFKEEALQEKLTESARQLFSKKYAWFGIVNNRLLAPQMPADRRWLTTPQGMKIIIEEFFLNTPSHWRPSQHEAQVWSVFATRFDEILNDELKKLLKVANFFDVKQAMSEIGHLIDQQSWSVEHKQQTARKIEHCAEFLKDDLWESVDTDVYDRLGGDDYDVEHDDAVVESTKKEIIKDWLKEKEMQPLFEWLPSWKSYLEQYILEQDLNPQVLNQEEPTMPIDSSPKKKRL